MSATFNFDKPTNRFNTNSLKWDKYPQDIIPLWVADTDFEVAPCIVDALHQRSDHAIFGYTRSSSEWGQVVVDYYARKHNWHIKPEWLVWVPGVVASMHLACRSLSTDFQHVLTPDIIYPHFYTTPTQSRKIPRMMAMTYAQERLRVDIPKLKAEQAQDVKVMLFCNPQNPGGCVYTQAELQQLDAYCQQHNLIVVSDEIHADLILDADQKHIPYAKLSDYAQEHSIVLGAASKTYNIPGLACSWAVIPNENIRTNFTQAMHGIISEITPFGYLATVTALQEAEDWRVAMVDYLRANRDYLLAEFAAIQGIHMLPLQSTYLAWLDVSGLQQKGITDVAAFFEQAGVGMAAGSAYNDPRFMRLNFGCQRYQLEEAIARIKQALAKI